MADRVFWIREGDVALGIAIESIELQVFDSQKIHDHSHGELKCLIERKKR